MHNILSFKYVIMELYFEETVFEALGLGKF